MPFLTRCSRPCVLAPVAALFLVLIVLVAPGRASAAQPGVVTDQTWWPPAADQERTKSALIDAGSKWVRQCVGWRDYEYANDRYQPEAVAQIDLAVERSVEAGQKIIMCVHETPGWANGSGSATKPPTNAADYADFLSYLANRYRGKVQVYEVWNEQNETRFWSGTNAQYVGLLKAAYPKVKAADSSARVAFGGVAAFNPNAFGFVQSAYTNGAKGSFDIMGWHPYTYNANSPETVRTDSGGTTSDSFTGYRRLRSMMAAQGDAKPIHLTEFGWSTTTQVFDPTDYNPWNSGVSEAVQAAYLTRAYKLLEQDPYVEVALWYNLRNNFWSHDADTIEDRFGLMRTDFTPKPAYHAFKSYSAGSGGSAPPSEPSPPSEPTPPSVPVQPPALEPARPPSPEAAPPTAAVRPRRGHAGTTAVRPRRHSVRHARVQAIPSLKPPFRSVLAIRGRKARAR